MSIEQLKKILESEKAELMRKHDVNKNPDVFSPHSYEAGTNRLLPLLEKAVENIEKLVHKLESSNRYDESCGVTNWEESEPEKQRYDIHKEATKKAREFLLSLSEATESVSEFTKMTEIKNV